MTKSKIMKEGYLGIDVSKGYADFALISSNKNNLEEVFQLDDNQYGHVKLLELISKFRKKHDLKVINAVLESTGGYENNWLSYLKNEGHWEALRVARVNPLGVKHDSHASMERTITDATSARRIAIYAINHPEKINWESSASDKMSTLRSLYKYIQTKVKQKVQLQNQLEKLIYSAFPELLKYMYEQPPKWLLSVLQEYPTAKTMREANVEDLLKIKGVGEKKAKMLLNKAEQSISWSKEEPLREIISGYASDILQLTQQIEKLKNTLEKEKELIAEIDLLISFQGIGKYSAVGLMIEIENIDRFKNVKKIASFFGIHPKLKQSGDKMAGYRMSKQGSPEVRGILFMVAKSAIVYNPHIRLIYDKLRAKGMGYNQAMGVLMHKILRIIYGMLKSKTRYDAGYDLAQQQRTLMYKKKQAKKVTNVDKKSKNRYQKMDNEAPISKRQLKKRKERLTSPGS